MGRRPYRHTQATMTVCLNGNKHPLYCHGRSFMDTPHISRATTLAMAAGTGISVANIYYCQPLLALMAVSLRVGHAQIGLVATLTQIGTALGMLLFVPIGDVVERRGLILKTCIAASIATALVSLAATLPLLATACLILGLTSVIPHLLLPFAAQLAPPERRGQVVGTVMSGLIVGILLARTASGFIGSAFGWRTMYVIASIAMLLLAVVLRVTLPKSHPAERMHYLALQKSLWALARESALLREASGIGFLFFAAFSSFWTTLAFFLQKPPYHYGAQVAGMFGLVAAGSVAAVPRIGEAIDRRSPRLGVGAGIVTCVAGFITFLLWGHWLTGLALGVVLMDVGVQAGHLSNQTRIYARFPHARSRANTVYMVTYFLGGSTGSLAGTYAWILWGWHGVCGAGLAFMATALAIHLLSHERLGADELGTSAAVAEYGIIDG